MADMRFQSVYLEGLPRQLDFRVARDRLKDRCGEYTLCGDLGLLSDSDSDDVATVAAVADPSRSFFIQDGDRIVPLTVGINSIGRLPDNNIVLKDECVSRRHCAIVVHRDGTCELHDIASKNGTLLNGSKIQGPTPMQAGDTVRLCNRDIKLLIKHNPKPA